MLLVKYDGSIVTVHGVETSMQLEYEGHTAARQKFMVPGTLKLVHTVFVDTDVELTDELILQLIHHK